MIKIKGDYYKFAVSLLTLCTINVTKCIINIKIFIHINMCNKFNLIYLLQHCLIFMALFIYVFYVIITIVHIYLKYIKRPYLVNTKYILLTELLNTIVYIFPESCFLFLKLFSRTH